jgi:hypothetical protein
MIEKISTILPSVLQQARRISYQHYQDSPLLYIPLDPLVDPTGAV